MKLREQILRVMSEIAVERGLELHTPIADDAVLLQTGLDSLGFATLVARLEEELSVDPFLLMKEPVYPRTLGEFISIYAAHLPQ